MKKNRRCILAVLLLLTSLLCLSACSDPNLAVEEYAMIVTEDDIDQLEMFPNLKYVDLRGSSCYEAIEAYIASHPNVTVRYSIQFGTERIESTAEELKLDSKKVSFDDILSNLKYLRHVRKVVLVNSTFSPDQLKELQDTYPELVFEYSVIICNEEYPHDAQSIDLSQLTGEDLDEAIGKLHMLSDVTSVELMTPGGTSELGLSDVKQLQDTFPNICFHYSFSLFGRTVSTTDEKIEFCDVKIGNEGEKRLRTALDILDACKVFKLDDCDLDDAVLAKLQDDFPGKKIVWRLHFGKYSILTDEEMIRINSDITDENAYYLKYCTNIKYMDIANNSGLSDFSFVGSLQDLKIAIITGTRIKDLTAFSSCQELEWLEMVYCTQITDLSPLSNLPNLQYLNVSGTNISDITAIQNSPMKQFVCIDTSISKGQKKSFINAHPDCLSTFTGSYPRIWGWRYIDKNKTYSEYYEAMIPIFHYDDPKFTGNKKTT